MDDPLIDLAALARSYGCWAADTVSGPAQPGPALEEAVTRVQADAVAVVHVRTAPR